MVKNSGVDPKCSIIEGIDTAFHAQFAQPTQLSFVAAILYRSIPDHFRSRTGLMVPGFNLQGAEGVEARLPPKSLQARGIKDL